MKAETEDLIAKRIKYLRENTDFAMTLFGGLIGYAIIAADFDGNILAYNEGAKQIYGYAPEEVVGRKNIEIFFPRDFIEKGGLQQIVSGLMNNGRFSHEVEKVRKNGERFPSNTLYTMTRDKTGNIVGFVAIVQDLTERKQFEDEIKRYTAELEQTNEELKNEVARRKQISEERDRLFDFSLDMLCIAGIDGYFKQLNPAWERTVGWKKEELLSKPYIEFVHPDDRSSTIEAAEGLSEGKAAISFDNRYLCKDGSYKWISWNSFPLVKEGLIFAVARDVTDRKNAEDKIIKLNINLQRQAIELKQANEKLEEIDRLKSMFIASMSHELRTPLNAIIGFSSILLNEWIGPLNAEQKENMSILLRSGKHLLALINDVIDVSKIEAGKIDVRAEEFELYDVIQEVVTLMKKDMDEKGLELKVEAIQLNMHTDRQRLMQCILNLVSNAVKFTEKGTIHVGAGLVPAQKQEGQPQGLPLQNFVEISVSDTGIGIKEEDMQKLFKSFVRLDSPLRSKVKGTGLGLYLTKKLVADVLNGEITATSEYGKGSRFVIRVPVKL